MTAALSDSLLLFGLDLGKLLEGGLPGLGAIAMEGSNGFACPGFEGLVGLEDGVKQADWAVVLRVEVVVPIVDQSTCQEGNIIAAVLHVTADHEASEEEVLHADMGACDEQADKDGNEVAEVVLEWMGVCGRSGNGCTEFVMLLVDVLVDAWVGRARWTV